MAYRLLVNPPVGPVVIFDRTLSQRQAATRAGAILRRDAGVGAIEAHRVVRTLATAAVETEIRHRSGYRFTVISR
jgi:hypothetical protein